MQMSVRLHLYRVLWSYGGRTRPSHQGKEMAMLQELTVEEMEQVSGGNGVSDALGGAGLAASGVGLIGGGLEAAGLAAGLMIGGGVVATVAGGALLGYGIYELV